jgi:hypothetical protein
MKHIYYVQAFRWGKVDNHSYIVGIWEDSNEAELAAKAEELERGGKYECVVYMAELNKNLNDE